MTGHRHLALAFAATVVFAPPTYAQASGPRDTLTLDLLQAKAIARDPRAVQLQYRSDATRLRMLNLGRERLPTLSAGSQAQYQSVVLKLPITLPNGSPVRGQPNDTYDASMRADATLLDPSRAGRRAVLSAELAEATAAVRATLYRTRQQVNDAFYAAAMVSTRADIIRASIADLAAQQSLITTRIASGAALPGELATLRAESLRREQDLASAQADRVAALAVLQDFTGAAIAESAVVRVPDAAALEARVRSARSGADSTSARPEFELFARRRDRLARQADVMTASTRPKVGAFARAGVGRPGLNVLNDGFEGYWLTGVQVQWAPWDWKRSRTDRDALAVEADIVRSEDSAFRDELRRATRSDLAQMDRLRDVLGTDDEIITLREEVMREAQARFREGVISAADYVLRENAVLGARLAKVSHQIELAQVRTRYLTTLGLEVR